ncbi:MAG: aminoacetone oxidase family FAD-binding enzyme [Paracoccus denitrificans]|nr:MAG: aminoacetone oxidase family FAD-binding enzyme [Paracoccus denitrificans]PZO83831.1 MAG: aminoacetone oxidase family FAD-binding enzyme [Paracoccus denitrificans]
MDTDVVILGAGAAGLFCAGSLAGTGLRVVVLDHARVVGEKIRISGGGRCNFTNLATSHERFLSANPRFSASALSGYSPQDFVALVDRAGIAWHEKTQGQLFCDGKATQIVDLLRHRMKPAELRTAVKIGSVEPASDGWRIGTDSGPLMARHVVVATGGRSIPKIGATGVGYDIATETGHRIVETRAGLVPLTFAEQELARTAPLAGVSVTASVSTKAALFRDGLLFTHRGLSGPSILQISSYWRPGQPLSVDLVSGIDVAGDLAAARQSHGAERLVQRLGAWLPARLADMLLSEDGLSTARLGDMSNARIEALSRRLHDWQIKPVGTEGYRTAEVTVGGVDTRDLDARTMQSRRAPGLYFIGEVVDVTGWLGGYNFQWAWASAHAAAKAIASA